MKGQEGVAKTNEKKKSLSIAEANLSSKLSPMCGVYVHHR